MMTRFLCGSTLAFVFGASLHAQLLTEAKILHAIKAGESKKFDHLVQTPSLQQASESS